MPRKSLRYATPRCRIQPAGCRPPAAKSAAWCSRRASMRSCWRCASAGTETTGYRSTARPRWPATTASARTWAPARPRPLHRPGFRLLCTGPWNWSGRRRGWRRCTPWPLPSRGEAFPSTMRCTAPASTRRRCVHRRTSHVQVERWRKIRSSLAPVFALRRIGKRL